MSEPLRGSTEPRVSTPPLRELTPETSLGFAAGEFAREVLRLTLYPWQEWLLIHMLEIVGDLDGAWHFRFRTVIVLVARQNGKSTLSQVLSLFFMYVLQVALVIGTAQDLDVANEIWSDALSIAEDTPELNDQIAKVDRNKTKCVELVTGSRYMVKALSRRVARSLAADLILLDELREHQTWAPWSAIANTTMARPKAQVLCLSNAGDALSVVLRFFRMTAHRALGDPDGICAAADMNLLVDDGVETNVAAESLGIFEWSAEPGGSVYDRDRWVQANPALGYGMLTERSLQAMIATSPEWVARTENLCQWTDAAIGGVFPPGKWEAGVVDGASQIDGEVVACVEVSKDRLHASIAYAGSTVEGLPQVELVAYVSGAEAAEEWLLSPERSTRPRLVLLRTRGANKSMGDDLRSGGLTVVEWKAVDVPTACVELYDAVRGVDDAVECGDLRHTAHDVLDGAAVSAVTRPRDGQWIWDAEASNVDVSPLYAVTGALWALRHDPTPEPAPSPYLATNRLVVI